MLNILRAGDSPSFQQGPFKIRRMRPGLVRSPVADPAFGPLSAVDRANLDVGTVVPMHEPRNDEILSYTWRGTMVHADSEGHRIPISPRKLMMMNAGRGFWHEESTPSEPVEMLQIFVRPEAADLPPLVAFWDRPVPPAAREWQLIAGPQGSNAPLTIRQRVVVFDTHLAAGDQVVPPAVTGMTSWVYVMNGAIVAGDERLEKGDACSDADAPLPPLRASRDTTLVAFSVDLTAPASRSGTISGD